MPVATGLLAFVLTAALTAIYLPLARGRRWLDEPNHRSAHSERVPSSGGIVVVLALLLTMLLFLREISASGSDELRWMLVLLMALCVTGAWDDRSALPVGLRLTVFTVIAFTATLMFLPIDGMHSWVGVAIATLAFAWLLNLYNFMDGIDGIAAVQCVLVAAAMAVLGFAGDAAPLYLGLAVSTAGAYGGFLLFNWPRARLFMGDAGSLSAGFLLGWLGLWGAVEGWVSATAWLILMSPFLLDTGFTLMRRAIRGERITQAHNEHLYQRLARHWDSHRSVDLALVALQLLWLIPLALGHAIAGIPAWLALLLALALQGVAIAKTATLQ